jgi:hypothetical protein
MSIVLAIAEASEAPRASHSRLSLILDRDNWLGTATSAQSVATAFADLGRPLLITDDGSSY